jgi:anti-sigma regulatory factor (Ser/Thr protein kinase)
MSPSCNALRRGGSVTWCAWFDVIAHDGDVQPIDGDAGRTARGGGRRSVLALRCPALAANLHVFRIELGRWLTTLKWPEDDREDFVLAVSEAVTNVVDHAYPAGAVGEVDLVGRLHSTAVSRHIVLLVRDWGRWRPPPQDPGFRGHGLTVIRECTDRLDVQRAPMGTIVTLVSRTVPVLVSSGTARRRPVLQRRPTTLTVAVPAVDRIVGQRRHRQMAILSRARQLRIEARALHRDAGTAAKRAQDNVQVSTRLCAEITRRLRESGKASTVA